MATRTITAVRRATSATEYASTGSVLRPLPNADTRTCAESLAGTSRTGGDPSPRREAVPPQPLADLHTVGVGHPADQPTSDLDPGGSPSGSMISTGVRSIAAAVDHWDEIPRGRDLGDRSDAWRKGVRHASARCSPPSTSSIRPLGWSDWLAGGPSTSRRHHHLCWLTKITRSRSLKREPPCLRADRPRSRVPRADRR